MIIKKDGVLEKFDAYKVVRAIKLASERVNVSVPKQDMDAVVKSVVDLYTEQLSETGQAVPVAMIHAYVVQSLKDNDLVLVAKSYQEFRDYKVKDAKKLEEIFKKSKDVLYLGDRENANFDSSLISTKCSLIRGITTSEMYERFYLSTQEKEEIKKGSFYIHDLRDMQLGSINCCLFDMATVLKGGFRMSNLEYTEPKTVLSALQVIGDIALCASAQQFGGFTIAQVDEVLLPYCKKSLLKHYNKLLGCGLDPENARHIALKEMTEELEQGFQALECKLNTIATSRGDYPFTTLTFGNEGYTETFDTEYDSTDKVLLRIICSTILQVRQKGHGSDGIPVLFPKLVYLYSKEQHKELEKEMLFEQAVECSSKCMMPDYLSIDDCYSTVSKVFMDHKVIASPMGCRAYLSPWADPDTGEYITVGRANIGAVSLNLPFIWMEAGQDRREFFRVLEDKMEIIRGFFKKRYEYIREQKCSTNPMAFTQGGFYNGFNAPTDTVGDLVQYMTASFGITALNELQMLYNGKTLKDDQDFAKEVVRFIQDVVQNFKELDGYLYALYGTPAENLTGVQAKQFVDTWGTGTVLGDIKYFSNSFHLHVSEDITPVEKQDKEFSLFHMIEGGHIQYVRLENPENFEATKAIIERGMEHGFYQGVNFNALYCNDCHKSHQGGEYTSCPECGSHNVVAISRVCGYLGFSKVNGESRMNEAKMQEIAERKSM